MNSNCPGGLPNIDLMTGGCYKYQLILSIYIVSCFFSSASCLCYSSCCTKMFSAAVTVFPAVPVFPARLLFVVPLLLCFHTCVLTFTILCLHLQHLEGLHHLIGIYEVFSVSCKGSIPQFWYQCYDGHMDCHLVQWKHNNWEKMKSLITTLIIFKNKQRQP